jgi:menaquinone-dependent protoporphyrinogen oxidase
MGQGSLEWRIQMKIFIAYGTSEGQTRKIVNSIENQITGLGFDTTVFDTSTNLGDLKPASFDKIIVAGSVHEHRHQQGVELFVLANLKTLRSKPTMFISTSLAAAFDDSKADAQDYVNKFVEHSGWQPNKILMVAGAVRHGEYGYYKEQILQHVVLKDHDLENQQSDHEFTNWDMLAKTIEEFVGTNQSGDPPKDGQ